MATGIKIENCLLQYKGRNIPLISGEFHYWRVLRENWPEIVAQIKRMGLQTVATYVPWNYHELKPGKYDFAGKTSPQRDLAGFLDLLKREGLYAIVRPGPYIYAEWVHGGPPERATRHDRMSPEFLAMARDYILNVCKVLAPRQITRGGNIVICQSDNEPYPPIESFGNQIGCFKDKGLFKTWLRDEKYRGDLALLNRRWRTAFTSFDDACFYFHEICVNVELPLAQRLLPGGDSHWRYADCLEFIGWYAARVVATIGGYLKEGGIEVPIYGNSWSPLYADFTRFCQVADLAGMDIYPGPFMETGDTIKDGWLYNIDILKMAEADVTNGNVWSAEFQSGLYPITMGYMPPQHYRFVPLALMARGMKGWNWYMLVNRDNWYHCPINEWGRTNEYFPYHQQAVAAALAVEPWRRRPVNDLSMLVYKPHRVIDPGNFEATFHALEAGGIAYSYFNPDSGKAPDTSVLLYTGADWIAGEAAAGLERFVRAGGTLVTFSRYPARDEFGHRISNLPFVEPEGARPTNLPLTVRYRGGSTVLRHGGHMDRKVNFVYFREVPGEPICVTLSTEAKEALVDIGSADVTTFAIGYARQLGRGKIIYIGSNPSEEILRLVLEQEGLAGHVTCATPKVSASVHRHLRNDSLALFVINRGDAPQNAVVGMNLKRLGLRPGAAYAVTDVAGGAPRTCRGRDLAALLVAVDAHDVAIRLIRKSR
ncbi:MAG: beta-galactosidase [Kiritimatiellae bacterium]|nr:beta-galactosidase [Kiritimatiellia bacterium]